MKKQPMIKDLYIHAYSWMMTEPRGFVASKMMLLTEEERKELALMTPEVVNVKTDRDKTNLVDIGRPSVYGNPYRIDEGRTRQQAIDAYRLYLALLIDQDDDFIEALENLIGKRLGCYCSPEDCHGDVLAELVRNRLIAYKIYSTPDEKEQIQ